MINLYLETPTLHYMAKMWDWLLKVEQRKRWRQINNQTTSPNTWQKPVHISYSFPFPAPSSYSYKASFTYRLPKRDSRGKRKSISGVNECRVLVKKGQLVHSLLFDKEIWSLLHFCHFNLPSACCKYHLWFVFLSFFLLGEWKFPNHVWTKLIPTGGSYTTI